jgi:hypothetical protein
MPGSRPVYMVCVNAEEESPGQNDERMLADLISVELMEDRSCFGGRGVR